MRSFGLQRLPTACSCLLQRLARGQCCTRGYHHCVSRPYPPQEVEDWPARGGANGSIRFEPELGYGCNAGA